MREGALLSGGCAHTCTQPAHLNIIIVIVIIIVIAIIIAIAIVIVIAIIIVLLRIYGACKCNGSDSIICEVRSVAGFIDCVKALRLPYWAS